MSRHLCKTARLLPRCVYKYTTCCGTARPMSLRLEKRMSSAATESHDHFFHYTSGRWLWDEERKLKERHVTFNVRELQRLAAESVGSKYCTSISKLAEGGYNKIFRLEMNDGTIVIARIPNPNAGPAGKTTASEVATMDFARTILNIPVPKVYAWSASKDNAAQVEYILMEEVRGARLDTSWSEMDLSRKSAVIKELIEIERKLLSVSFTRHGSIYFANDAFPGCEAAELVGEASEATKLDARTRFSIGPVVDRDFWSSQRSSMAIDRGPWKDPKDYLTAIAEREISWLEEFAVPRQPGDIYLESKAQNSPEAHLSLYRKFLDVIPYLMPQNEELARPTLWHWDIHSGNLFVEGDHVSGLIDWQDAWVGPLFLQYRQPKLVDYNGEVLLKLPEEYEELQEGPQKVKIRNQVERSVVLYMYESETAEVNPVLGIVLRVPFGRLRRETIEFASGTWDGDILPFRQCLIRIERHWHKFGIDNNCPFQFTDEELRTHHRDAEGWNERAEFWDSLAGLVDRDGWTSTETFEQALDMFAELREEGLNKFTGNERARFDAQTRWAVRSHDGSNGVQT